MEHETKPGMWPPPAAEREALAAAIATRLARRASEPGPGAGTGLRAERLETAREMIAHLATATSTERLDLFLDYLAWFRIVQSRRGGRECELALTLECAAEVLAERVSEGPRALPSAFLARGIAALPELPTVAASLLDPGLPHADLTHRYLHALLRGDRAVARRLVLEAVESGLPVREIYLHVFQRSQRELGRLWQAGEVTVAQEHYCTAATQLIMSQLYPYIFTGDERAGTFLATSVEGELHELGVRMVADFFEMAGWDTHYLGANTPTQSVVEAVIRTGATLVGVAATITYRVSAVEAVIRAIRAEARCAHVKVLVGGYPFNVAPDLWRVVGADGHAVDAEQAVALGPRLTGGAA